jgi:YidC/Oxa1 family membrane protein insertase
MFEIPASALSWFYGLTNSYIVAIALMSVVVMAITTPLTLKSTKGMLEMQKLAPEMRRLQNEYRNDRQKLNEEMMKLYQEHKVNPMASCLPIVAQMPVFIVMFRVLRGLEYRPTGAARPIAEATASALDSPEYSPEVLGFIPRFLSLDSKMYESLFGETEILSLGLDLSLSPLEAITESFSKGVIYVLLVVLLAGLYFVQQRMVAARASISPTMSPSQQKLMQYLPVVFAAFQLFFMMGLVVYYIFQTLLRIAQQAYITRRFYGHDEALGRQAQRAGVAAREEASKSGESGGLLAQAKRDLGAGRGKDDDVDKANSSKPKREIQSKRVTQSKAAAAKASTDKAGGGKGRPTPSRKDAQSKRGQSRPKSTRPKSGKKKR